MITLYVFFFVIFVLFTYFIVYCCNVEYHLSSVSIDANDTVLIWHAL